MSQYDLFKWYSDLNTFSESVQEKYSPPLPKLGLENTSRKMYFYIQMHIIKVKICSKVTEKSEVPGDGGGFSRIRFSTNDFSS